MNPNSARLRQDRRRVVICFDFIIFALWIPTSLIKPTAIDTLWFASILLFLHYESQPSLTRHTMLKRCDLLRFYYFCIMNPNFGFFNCLFIVVVICFDFIIFALWIPTPRRISTGNNSCDLLRFYYFCIMNPNDWLLYNRVCLVVICFDFIIFALWIPTIEQLVGGFQWLWFASILLFLHYESQPRRLNKPRSKRCDLLRFYYFCIMNPNLRWFDSITGNVVICFDFIIFALWIPTCIR